MFSLCKMNNWPSNAFFLKVKRKTQTAGLSVWRFELLFASIIAILT